VRASGFFRHGGPEVLEVVQLPDPPVGGGEVAVRVAAATINPADLLFRSGGLTALIKGPPPYVGGLEFAGSVDTVGAGGTWQVGDRVAGITTFIPAGRGAHAEHVVVHSDSLVAVPEGADLAAWATLPMNGLTVRLALDRLGLVPGSTLLVTGGAGAVGSYAVELGVADGLRVIAIAGARDEELVRGLGAAVFVPRGEAAAVEVRDAVPGGVDGVIDAALVGGAILPAVKDGGRIAAVRRFGAEPERGITVEVVSVRDYLRAPAKLASLACLVEEGRLTLRVAETYPPERAAAAHRRLERGGVRGRLVLVFDERR
jgi:NADPH:quinone reductase-like Zn-dependent oxidoreductase